MKLNLNCCYSKFFLYLLLSFRFHGFSQEPVQSTRAEELPEILISSSLLEAPLLDLPYRVSVVDSLRMAETAPASLPDALRGQPGISVSRTANGQATPIIRGFTGFRNLFLVDGVRLNNSVFREGANQYFATVDSYAAERIELIQGPTSVFYGSDAIGGAVNVITKGPGALDEAPDQWFAHGQTSYRYASAEQSQQAHVESDFGIGGQWGAHFGISWKEFGDVRAAGIGVQPNTGFDELAWDIKLQSHPDEDSTLTLAFQQTEMDDVSRSHSTRDAVSWRGTTPGTDRQRLLDQTRRLAYLQYEASFDDGPVQKMRASLSWHQQAEQQDRVRANGRRSYADFEVNTLGFWLEMDSRSPIGELTYGASFYSDHVGTDGVNFSAGGVPMPRIQGPVGDDARYDMAAVFIQDKITITEATELHIGTRYDHVRAKVGRYEDPNTGAPASLDESWGSIVSSARALWRKDEFSLFGGISQSFRAPNLSDLTRFDSARTDEIETPSPSISPEHFLSYEIGARWERDAAHFGLNLFYTQMRDLIVRTPTGKVINGETEVTKTNGGTGYLMGIELDAAAPITQQLSLYGNFAWTDGEEESKDVNGRQIKEATNRLIPWTANAGLRYQFNDAIWVAFELEAAAKVDKLSTTNRLDTERIPPGGTPSYAVLHLRAGWRVNDHLTFNGAIENLTNKEYRNHGSGINQPGLNFVVAATLSF
ncbi:MAG: TonB-dependent receptor [Verrucomicrobia bacterium]|nr:TonB-dependent receptor [Verrucomicrobiota bacterium]